MSRLDHLPDSLIESLSEPKIHSFFSDILNHLPEFGVNVAMSVGLATTFVAFFFFTYAKDVERQIVIKNVNYIVDDLGDSVVPFLNKDIKKQLYYSLDAINLPNMDEADKQVANDNHKLLVKSTKLFGTSLVVLLVFSFILCKLYNLDFFQHLITNILLLCAIAFTEYCFLNLVIFDWISADPNKVKEEVIKSIVVNK